MYLQFLLVFAVFSSGIWVGSSVEEYHQQKVQQKAIEAMEVKKDATINLLLQRGSVSSAELNSAVNKLQHNLSEDVLRTNRVNADTIQTCQRLLAESAGLHQEGLGLLRELNTRLDAFIELHR